MRKFITKHKKNLIKIITVLLIVTLFIPLFTVSNVAYADDEEGEANFVEKSFSWVVRSFGLGLKNMLLSDPKYQLDGLVFNTVVERDEDGKFIRTKNRADMGLTLLASEGTATRKVAEFFYTFYTIFEYIALSLLAPIAIWISIYFQSAAFNAQKKAELKDKLFRLFVTLFLLSCMPDIIDMFLVFNGLIVDIFKTVAHDYILGGNFENQTLMESFYQQAKDTGKLAQNVVYLMSVFLNVWFVIFYFIRDFTISFLFLVFPVLAVLYPINKGAITHWFKEMASNIFTQAIHAMLLTISFGIAFLPEGPTTMPLMIYSMVSMAMIIPMTATFKRFIGLEGNIGAAKSMAGLGLMMGAYHIGRGMLRDVKQGASNFKEGYNEWKDAKAGERLAMKGYTGTDIADGKSDLSQQLSPVGSGSKVLSVDDYKAKRRQARKKMLQSAGRLTGGVGASALSAAGMSVFGGQAALIGAAGGMVTFGALGEKVGQGTGRALNQMGASLENTNAIAQKSIMEGISYEEAELQYYGVDYDKNTMDSEYVKQQLKFKKAMTKYNAIGRPELALRKSSKHAPKKHSADELRNMEGLKLYQSDKVSALYQEGEHGEMNILRTFEGDKNLEEPVVRDIKFGGTPSWEELSNESLKNIKLETGLENMTFSNKTPLSYKDITNEVQLEKGVELPKNGEVVFNISREGTSMHLKDRDTGAYKFIGTALGDTTLAKGQVIQSIGEIRDGKILEQMLHQQVQQTSVNEENMQPTQMDKSNIPQYIRNYAKPGEQIDIIIHDVENEEGGVAMQTYVNSQGEILGSHELTGEMAGMVDQMGQTITVNITREGNWQAVGKRQMDSVDMHRLAFGNEIGISKQQQIQAMEIRRQQLREMVSQYEIPEVVDIDQEIVNVS